MTARRAAPLILHIHPDATGGGAARTARLVRALGSSYRHAVLPAQAERRDWLQDARVNWIADFPPLAGKPMPGRLQRLAKAMLPYDLVVTHGYGAIDAAMARTAFSEAYQPPPLIHHEWSHKPVISQFERRKRNWYRRVAFGKLAGLIVDTEAVERRALVDWQQPMGRVKLLADGIDVRAFANRPRPDALPSLVKRAGEWWLGAIDPAGTLAGLAEAVALLEKLPERCHLVWATAYDRTEAVAEIADARSLNHRVHNVGEMPALSRFVGLFDTLYLPDDTAEQREAVLAAMASGLPVCGTDGWHELLAEPNHGLLAESGERQLDRLAGEPALAREIGEANRRRALAEFDDAKLVEAYRRLFDSALALPRR